MTSDAPPSTGLVAGKYELVGLIGRGGMGSVWEGRHKSLGTRVAVKFIESDYANSQEARTRFDNEARAAARIQSKHAIQIYDHGVTDDGKPYIVMEFLAGEPLDKRVERLGRLSLKETARIIMQVCRGLARAHELGIIHRDLKPENIFLVRSPDDDDEIAKVLDFGIAKIKGPPDAAGGVSSSTKTGAVLGTPFYMSPEQARGLRNVDHRTDLWSLGIITFKCLTGILPFEGESVGDLLVKICTAPVPVPSQVLQGLPPAFDAWFLRALEREPDRRFATAAELSEALAYAAGMSVRRPSAPDPNAAFMATAIVGADAISGPQGPTSGARAATPPSALTPSGGAYGAPALPSATSAPFTAPAGAPSSSSRGLIIAASGLAAGAALVVGFVAVTRLTGGKPPPARPAPPVSAVTANAVPPASAQPQSSASTAPAPDAGASPLAALAPSAKPSVHGPREKGQRPGSPAATKPPAGTPPLPPLVATQAPAAPTKPPPPPLPTAPQKPSPVNEPGY